MRLHRAIALVSTTAIFGLLGVAAQASNNAAPRPKTAPTVVGSSLRAKVQNARIDGCGG